MTCTVCLWLVGAHEGLAQGCKRERVHILSVLCDLLAPACRYLESLTWHHHTWQRTAAAAAGPGDAATAPNAQRLSRYTSPARRAPVAGSHCPRRDSGHGRCLGFD